MVTKSSPIGWKFWFKWVLASTVGLVISALSAVQMVGGAFLIFLLSAHSIPSIYVLILIGVTAIVVGAAVGAVVGSFQWLALPQFFRAGKWVFVSALGWISGGLILVTALVVSMVVAVLGRGISAYSGKGWLLLLTILAIVLAATVGALVGSFQSFVLRPQLFRAERWVFVNIISFAGAAILLILAVVLGFRGSFVSAATLSLTSALIWGAVTGIGFVWLFRQPFPKQPLPEQSLPETPREE